MLFVSPETFGEGHNMETTDVLFVYDLLSRPR